jgi:hypothetical protein
MGLRRHARAWVFAAPLFHPFLVDDDEPSQCSRARERRDVVCGDAARLAPRNVKTGGRGSGGAPHCLGRFLDVLLDAFDRFRRDPAEPLDTGLCKGSGSCPVERGHQ